MNFEYLNFTVSLYSTSVVSFLFGLFVLLKSKGNTTNKLFSVWSFSVAVWSFFHISATNAENIGTAYFFYRLSLMPVILVTVATLHFFLRYLKFEDRKKIIWSGYLVVAVFAVLVWTRGALKLVSPAFFLDRYMVATPLLSVLVSVFGFYLLVAFCYLIRGYRSSKGAERKQILFLIIATSIAHIGSSANILLAYGYYIPFYTPYANYLVAAYHLVIAYAVFKYHLMNITIVIRKALVLSVAVALVSGFIIGASFLSTWLHDNISWFKPWFMPVIAGIFSVVIGRIIWKITKEIDQLKYVFVTVAAHKLRTPLTEIKWSASELLIIFGDAKNAGGAGKEYVGKIMSATDRLIDLTNELLSVSRSEDKSYEMKFEESDLGEIADQVIDLSSLYIKHKGLTLSKDYESDLPPVKIDMVKISFVIKTMLDNAIAYTKDRIGISITAPKGKIVFRIEDNGIGISQEDQRHVFSKFYRTIHAYRSETEGMGVNLSLSKTIIEKHRGSIGVRSKVGKGSEFWFELPV